MNTSRNTYTGNTPKSTFHFVVCNDTAKVQWNNKISNILINFDKIQDVLGNKHYQLTVSSNRVSRERPKYNQRKPKLEQSKPKSLLFWIDKSNKQRLVRKNRVAYQQQGTTRKYNTIEPIICFSLLLLKVNASFGLLTISSGCE